MAAVTRSSDEFDGDGFPDEDLVSGIRCNFCGGATVPHVTCFTSCRRCLSCGEMVHLTQPRPPITNREASIPDNFDVASGTSVSKLENNSHDLEEERLHRLGG